jgi:hypothetical protein
MGTTLYRWHMCGELVRRMDVKASEIADDLDLATPLCERQLSAMNLQTDQGWIVIARHEAREVIQIHGNRGYAYKMGLSGRLRLIGHISLSWSINCFLDQFMGSSRGSDSNPRIK